MNIELLLSRIAGITKKYDLIYQKTGGYFNIFEIANVASDEVIICRVLYELLNPKGSHYQKDTYLRLFVKNVLKIDFTEKDYTSVKVFREYVLDSNRRIDLVIETRDRFIPIEVKIDAGDQDKQCYDYYQKALNSNVFYITLYGSPPSKDSAWKLTKVGAGYSEVTQLSFENDILHWIETCLADANTIRTAPIREILQQFATVIRKHTNQLDEDKEMEIRDILTMSKENMTSAIEIASSLKACKTYMIQKVLSAIEQELSFNKLSNQYDYEFNGGKLVNSYDDKKSSSFPGLSYFIKSLGNGIDIWLRVEIDDKIFVGFCTPINSEARGKQLTEDVIRKQFPMLEPAVDGWWISWELLPIDDDDISPDFKAHNDAYLDLFDEKAFDDFIIKSVKSIENMMKTIY